MTVIRQTEATDTTDTSRKVYLSAGHSVTFLYNGADQDGWNGEIIVRTGNGQILAVNPDDLKE